MLVLCDVSWFLRGAADCCRDLWRCCGRRVFDAWADSNGPCLPGPFMDSHVPLGNPCGFFGGMEQYCCSIFGRLSWVGIQSPITSYSYQGRKQKWRWTAMGRSALRFRGGVYKKISTPLKVPKILQVRKKPPGSHGWKWKVTWCSFPFEKVFPPIFRGEFAVSLFGGLGWQKLLLKRARKRGIDLGLIPFFGMGFKKA